MQNPLCGEHLKLSEISRVFMNNLKSEVNLNTLEGEKHHITSKT